MINKSSIHWLTDVGLEVMDEWIDVWIIWWMDGWMKEEGEHLTVSDVEPLIPRKTTQSWIVIFQRELKNCQKTQITFKGLFQ